MKCFDDVNWCSGYQVFQNPDPPVHVDYHQLPVLMQNLALLFIHRHKVRLEKVRTDQHSVKIIPTQHDGRRCFCGNLIYSARGKIAFFYGKHRV